MPSDSKRVFVIGATGQQGGAAVRHLLARGWEVHALVRDRARPAAEALERDGAIPVQGDLDDIAALRKAMECAPAVFCVLSSYTDQGVEGEVRWGTSVAHIAKQTGVEHFVYSSVGGAERDSGIPHFQSKWEIEQHIQHLGLPATVLRPVFFMDNYAAYARPKFENGLLTITYPFLPADKSLQMIAVEDIGGLAAIALDRREDFVGCSIEIAGDELTMQQIADTFEHVTHVPTRFVEQPIDQLRRFAAETVAMYEWFNHAGYKADIPAIRAIHPDLMTLADWLRFSNWNPKVAVYARS